MVLSRGVNKEPHCTIMVLGQDESGKSHLIRDYIDKLSNKEEKDYKVKKVENGEKLSKSLLDIGFTTKVNVDIYNGMGGKWGEISHYEGIREDKETIEHLRDQDVDVDYFLVTADMTKPDCRRILRDYLDMLDKYAPDAQVIIVGTKSHDKNRFMEEDELLSVLKDPRYNKGHHHVVITDVKRGMRNEGPLGLAVKMKLDNDRKNDDKLIKVIDESLNSGNIKETKEIVAIRNIIGSRESSEAKLGKIRAISEIKYTSSSSKDKDNVNIFYKILKNNNSVDSITELQNKFLQNVGKKEAPGRKR